MTEILSGQDLINAGMSQGKWFRVALEAANKVIKDATAQLYKILAEGPGE